MATGMRTEVLALLTAGVEVPIDALRSALVTEAHRMGDLLPDGCAWRADASLGEEELRPLAAAAATSELAAAYPDTPYDAVAALTGPPGALNRLVGPLRGLAERHGQVFDASRSIVVAGTEETFIAGAGDLMMLFAMRRRADLSRQCFHDYWRLEHTKLTMQIQGFRYRQMHVAVEPTRVAADAAGLAAGDFDGVVQGYADDVEQLVALSFGDLADALYEDERRFMDHRRSRFGTFRRIAL